MKHAKCWKCLTQIENWKGKKEMFCLLKDLGRNNVNLNFVSTQDIFLYLWLINHSHNLKSSPISFILRAPVLLFNSKGNSSKKKKNPKLSNIFLRWKLLTSLVKFCDVLFWKKISMINVKYFFITSHSNDKQYLITL